MSDYSKRRQELRKQLKKKALDRLSETDSNCTVHTIISQNEMFHRMRKMRQDIPDDHKSIMRDLRDDFNQFGQLPRAVMQLNALERLSGSNTSWITKTADLLLHTTPPTSTIH